MIGFKGVVSKVLYKSDDFKIALFKTQKRNIKIVGYLLGVEKGTNLTIKGTWQKHEKFGEQFLVEQWEHVIPQDKDQILTFLKSPIIKGCGKKQAEKIVNTLGKDALNIIVSEKESCLLGIDGIGPKRAKMIVDSIVSTFEVQKIVSLYLKYGISTNIALQAFKTLGAESISILRKNPYKLVDLGFISFIKADDIGRRMKIMPASGNRIEACIKFMLKKLCFQLGHTFISEIVLLDETEKVLNVNADIQNKITVDELKNSINNLEEQSIIIENGCVYPKFLFYQEDKLARKLSILKGSRGGGAMPFSEKLLGIYQKKYGLILGEQQREAIRKLFNKQLLILTGGPGTGKTTVIHAIIEVYRNMYPENEISLVAPTGRASRKLSEVAGIEASTIHRLIEYRKGKIPKYNSENKLSCKLLVIDEMSMVDLSLAYHLLQAIQHDTKVLFVGDIDQLPSVNPGNVLREMINADLPVVRLTQVFRQSNESQIINNAHRVNKGKPIVIDNNRDDFFFLLQKTPELINTTIIKSAMRFIELGYSPAEIQILSPVKKGEVGTISLNERLREALNPPCNNKKELRISNRLFREGDKVMQIKNNYDKQVFNGDIGIISKISNRVSEDGKLVDVMLVEFSGKQCKYFKQEVNELELGYSITIHKSQGGEAAVVIIPVTNKHCNMLVRNLIYTGMTRAREKMIFVGTYEALQTAINNNQIASRNSGLSNRIKIYDKRRRRLLNEVTP